MASAPTDDPFNPHVGLPTETQITNLLASLERYLPFSLPLYRRLQFYLRHPSDSSQPLHARIFQASASDSDINGPAWRTDIDGQRSLQREFPCEGTDKAQTPWLAGYVDLSRVGETQIWIFANWECEAHTGDQIAKEMRTRAAELQARRSLLKSFLRFIYTQLVPMMPTDTPSSFNSVKKRPGNLHAYSPSAVFLGSCSLSICSLIPEPVIRRDYQPYLKYIFPSTAYEPTSSRSSATKSDTLPPDYFYGDLRHPQDLQLALNRTNIPRTVDTLALLPSRAVYFQNKPDPVAWGFLGVDASLSSLHTEPEHRGQGLAVLLARELLRMQADHFKTLVDGRAGEESGIASGSNWGHADVGEANPASIRVMEKAGGKAMWKNCWVEVELQGLFGYRGMWKEA